jgi:hypothetical protein
LGSLADDGGASLVDLCTPWGIRNPHAAALSVSSSIAPRDRSMFRLGRANGDDLDVLDDVPIAILSNE